jgi:microcystin-dependent protein
VGEIRMFGGNFAPAGWQFCDGALMPIAENETLFQLIGTTYGGDGESTFARPDLRSRVPIHLANTLEIGQTGGTEQVTLTVQQIPTHTHPLLGAAVTGNQTSPQGAVPANTVTITPYINTAPDSNMNAAAIAPVGGSQPHDNRQPFLCVNFIISMFGIFPSQT